MISCNMNQMNINSSQVDQSQGQKIDNSRVYATIFSKKIIDNEKGIFYEFCNQFYKQIVQSSMDLDKTVSFRAQKLILISIFIILNIFVASISFESFLAIIIRGTFLSAINIVIVSFFIVNMIITLDIDEKDNNAGGFTNAIFKFFNKMFKKFYDLIGKNINKIRLLQFLIIASIIWFCIPFFLSYCKSINFVAYMVLYFTIWTFVLYIFFPYAISFIFQTLLRIMILCSNKQKVNVPMYKLYQEYQSHEKEEYESDKEEEYESDEKEEYESDKEE